MLAEVAAGQILSVLPILEVLVEPEAEEMVGQIMELPDQMQQ
jgi:hypothetical protein